MDIHCSPSGTGKTKTKGHRSCNGSRRHLKRVPEVHIRKAVDVTHVLILGSRTFFYPYVTSLFYMYFCLTILGFSWYSQSTLIMMQFTVYWHLPCCKVHPFPRVSGSFRRHLLNFYLALPFSTLSFEPSQPCPHTSSRRTLLTPLNVRLV